MSFEEVPTLNTPPEPEAQPSVEGLLSKGSVDAETMALGQERLQQTLDSIRPESESDQKTLEAIRGRVQNLTAIREDVQSVARNAALEAAFRHLEEEKDSVEVEDVMQVFETYPELAESFLEHVLEQKHLKAPSAQLVQDVEQALEDLKGGDTKAMRGLALRTTERVVRAVISAGTLGIGAVVYDCVKDAYVSIRARNALRAQVRQSLLNSVAPAPLTV